MRPTRAAGATLLRVAVLVLAACAARADGGQVVQAASETQAVLSTDLPLRREQAASGAPTPWLALGLLLAGLAGAGAWAARRRGSAALLGSWPAWRPTGGGITRLTGRALTPQASLHVVRWNGEDLLLACTPHQVSVLARRPSAQDEAAP